MTKADPPKLRLRLPDEGGGNRGAAVFAALRTGLREGVLQPGDRLREEDVAEALSVSRTPVREAFNRLLGRKLVERSAGRGLVVRRLSPGDMFEVYAMREVLEGAAARFAAQHRSEPELMMLRSLHDRFAALPSDAALKAKEVNLRFHEAIHVAARNRFLDAALAELTDTLSLLGPATFYQGGRSGQVMAEHAAILDAIAARDPDRAEQTSRIHIRNALAARLDGFDGLGEMGLSGPARDGAEGPA